MGALQSETRDSRALIARANAARHWFFDSGFVLPRKGALPKLLRRLPMSQAERDADIALAPDRAVMREMIHPAVAARGGSILLVGVQSYTAPYLAALEAGGGTCWTIDVDPSVAQYGADGRHATGCISQIAAHFPGTRFTSIIMSGVLGFGVNRLSHQVAVAEACAAALEPGGMLVLGWNDRRIPDCFFAEITADWYDFRPLGDLPSRIRVASYDHNFAFLRLKPPVDLEPSATRTA